MTDLEEVKSHLETTKDDLLEEDGDHAYEACEQLNLIKGRFEGTKIFGDIVKVIKALEMLDEITHS